MLPLGSKWLSNSSILNTDVLNTDVLNTDVLNTDVLNTDVLNRYNIVILDLTADLIICRAIFALSSSWLFLLNFKTN